MNHRLPGGQLYLFGLFHNDNQIGFQCFANYVPYKKGKQKIFHSNRTVVHPDYQGFGLGIKLINATSEYMKQKYKYKIMAKFSSIPVYKAMLKQKQWKLLKIVRKMDKMQKGGSMERTSGYREYGNTSFSFLYVGS